MSALRLSTQAEDGAVFDAGLQCSVKRLEYNPATRIGFLRLQDGHCTDMSGAISAFKAIDADVQAIVTWSGTDRDTAYHRQDDGTWRAVRGSFHAQLS